MRCEILKNCSGRSDFGLGQLDLTLDLIGTGSARFLQTRGSGAVVARFKPAFSQRLSERGKPRQCATFKA
jgi:hypothetical protein